MRFQVWVPGLAIVLVACAPAHGLGERCESAGECEGGLCEDLGSGALACTRSCAAPADCPEFACGQDGFCVEACAEGSTSGGGASREVCQGGVYVACASLSPTVCTTCGCEPFGGGVCLGSRGCVVPMADGAACTDPRECASGACYADTDTCGAPRADGAACAAASDCASGLCFDDGTCDSPRGDGEPCGDDSQCASGSCLSDETCGLPRAMGEPCSVDADCSTGNCSTDGDQTEVGVCHQALGTSCEFDTTTCNRCLGAVAGSSGICSRDACDPVDAPSCPTYRDHQFECVMSTDGLHRCYERCLPDDEGETWFHRCYDVFDSCTAGGGYCN